MTTRRHLLLLGARAGRLHDVVDMASLKSAEQDLVRDLEAVLSPESYEWDAGVASRWSLRRWRADLGLFVHVMPPAGPPLDIFEPVATRRLHERSWTDVRTVDAADRRLREACRDLLTDPPRT